MGLNSQRTPITWQKITKKSIAWFFWLFFVALMQTGVFARYLPFGAVPELVLPCVIAIAIYDGERSAVICGIMGGVIIDSLGSGGFSASALVYMLLASAVAVLTHSVLSRDFLSWLISSVCSLLAASLAGALYAAVNVGAGFFEYLGEVFWRQLLSSLVCSLPFYLLTWLIWHFLFDSREMEG